VLLSFEGIDGSGKTTQIKRLKAAFESKGAVVSVFREPGGTLVSEQIRSVLLDDRFSIPSVTEALLFVAARSAIMELEVIPRLERNEIVIMDRFIDSTLAYQGFGRSILSVEEINRLNALACKGIEPVLTLFLDVPLSVSASRREGTKKDRMEQSGDAFYERVIAGYKSLQKLERFVTINSNREEDAVFASIVEAVSEKTGFSLT
jgi:dTMP kinase